jgi:predicted phosphodiesterase
MNPHSVTFLYGNFSKTTELRFNWITDGFVGNSVITYEEKESFEANGHKFSANARKVQGTSCITGGIKDGGKIDYEKLLKHSGVNHSAHYSHKVSADFKADSYYYYSVGGEPVLIKTPAFKRTFSFLWITDPQQDNYSDYRENFGQAIEQALENEVEFVLCTGDHAEHGYNKDCVDGFFKAGKKMFDTKAFYPVLGNHDVMGSPKHTGSWDSIDPSASMFKGRFNCPLNGTEKLHGINYFFTYGSVLFLVLQTNPWHVDEYALDEQILWLHNVCETHKNMRKIAVMHQGIYCASHKPVFGYEKLAAAFDECGIMLVLSGHNHVYSRTKPMKDFKPAENGTVYITGGTISSNCAWGGYIYTPERRVPEENGLAIKDIMAFVSLTDLVDENNKNVYHIITVGENDIRITAKRASDGTVLVHNDIRPSDTAEEYETAIAYTQ